VGALTKTHLEPGDIASEEFLEMLRFEQRDKVAEQPLAELPLEELPGELLRECSG
jgi:hypothetical protein